MFHKEISVSKRKKRFKKKGVLRGTYIAYTVRAGRILQTVNPSPTPKKGRGERGQRGPKFT